MATPLNTLEYTAALLLARKKGKKGKGKPGQHPKGLIGRGNHNRAAVRGVQERLSELGYEVSTDGVFGEETESALREFQKSRDALVDGVVGKETLGKLVRAKRGDGGKSAADTGLDAVERVVSAGRPQPANSGRALGRARANQRGGGSGSRVRGSGKAKKAEKAKGPHGGAIDPVTGKERATTSTGPIGSTKAPTTPSNMSFEEQHPRGEAGTSSGGKFVAKGDSGEEVQGVQKKLNEADGKKLKEDGLFGPKTEAAIKDFQGRAGLTVDGIVGPKTSASLRRRARLVKRANKPRATRGPGARTA